jgi:hypothetical protein
MIERCGDRQRKFDGLKKWPFHLFIESLPVMLQVALLLLVCGLCRHMASINPSVAGVLISLTVLGGLFYLGIVIAGTSSYECPFQTPVSTGLCSLWRKVDPHITPILLPIVTASAPLFKGLPQALMSTKIRPCIASMLLHITAIGTQLYGHLQHFWEDTLFLCQTIHTLVWSPSIPHSHSPPLPTRQPAAQETTSWLATVHSLWENIECKILLLALRLPQIYFPLPTPLPTIPSTFQWLTSTALDTLQKTNTNDVQCVSWILWNITDPEALDTAIRLATTIWWFQDGLNTEPPYDLFISTLKGCFDSTGRVYPGLRDRAYSSAQAILWIHICAVCVSEEFALRFPLPVIHCDILSLDCDLKHLLGTYAGWDTPDIIAWMYGIASSGFTPAYMQWTSNALLHLSWTKQNTPSAFCRIRNHGRKPGWHTIPVNAMLNHLLVSSIFLGQPIDAEVLKVQDKSYAISLFHSLPCSHCYLPGFTWNRLCLNSPKQ